MSDLQLLHQLQELDLQVEEQSRALVEIENALGESSDLISARARVGQLQELLHEQERRLRELEWDVADITRHVQQDEQKLYGGTIRNPKELDGLQRDLEQRKTRRGELEEHELQVMAEIETTQADLKRARDALDEVQANAEAKNRDLIERQDAVKARLASLNEQRSELARSVSPANLAMYERLRKEKRGRAVSTVERSTCQGCRIALPMGLVQRVRAGRDFVFCPSCGRILYS